MCREHRHGRRRHGDGPEAASYQLTVGPNARVPAAEVPDALMAVDRRAQRASRSGRRPSRALANSPRLITISVPLKRLRGGSSSRQSAPMSAFALRSPAFQDGAPLPRRHTCEGQDVSPALERTAPSAETRSRALVVEDPDAPGGTGTHWLAWGSSRRHVGSSRASARRWSDARGSARFVILVAVIGMAVAGRDAGLAARLAFASRGAPSL